jgi:hypothetical protein
MIAEAEYIQKLASYKDDLETVMYKASYYWHKEHHETLPNLTYDIGQANLETFSLGKSGDLCYDRPSIGFVYNLFYQPRRINSFLTYFARAFYQISKQKEQKQIDIFDLGAGAGAIQCAIGLAYHVLCEADVEIPNLRIVNIDTSPFMLNFNMKYLWTQFCSHFPHANRILTEYSLNSWAHHDGGKPGSPWFIASYLFDQSDNQERLQSSFLRLTDLYKPEKIFLLSPINKAKMQDAVCDALNQQKDYEKVAPAFTQKLLFSGPVERFRPFRNWLGDHVHPSFGSTASWDEHSLYATILERRGALTMEFGKNKVEKIDLFTPPKISRSKIKLNEDQSNAALHDSRPTIIMGPAGSGKTVVMTERIKNIVEASDYDPNLRILFTTFNKGLIRFVHRWLKDLLDGGRFQIFDDGGAVSFQFPHSTDANIKLLNFDKLPTRIGEVNGAMLQVKDEVHFDIFREFVIPKLYEEFGLGKDRMINILTPEFLLEEYHRVIYGLSVDIEQSGAKDKEVYLTCERRGRGFGLTREQREVVWSGISRYLIKLTERNWDSIITRRHKFLRLLRSGKISQQFDHIFVDEFQDCTPADIDTFYLLLTNPDHLIICGDVAQAVHLGKTATSRIPRLDGMRKRRILRLKGSYRLPFRVSEAIQPFSEYVHTLMDKEPDILEPYRDAPPGARPMVVYASSTEEMAHKIKTIVAHYKIYYQAPDEGMMDDASYLITVLEWDVDLYSAINGLAESKKSLATTNSILALKGLEKNCVVWSTRSRIGSDEDQFQFIYTILTRTTSLLIIAIFEEIPEHSKQAILKLRRDRLICWDEASEQRYSNLLSTI